MEKVEIEYESVREERCGLAKGAMILGLVGFVLSFVLVGIVPGVVAMVMGLVASFRIQREPGVYGGSVFARAGIWLGIGACVVPMGIVVLMPCGCGGSRELSNRSACGANVRGIMQSMNVYAADNNDVFPVVPFAPYAGERVSGAVAMGTAEDGMKALYVAGSGQDGSVLASVWMLTLKNYASPKQFMCKSDPYLGATAGELTNGHGAWHVTFQTEGQVSYSFAYPWGADGKVGAWWNNTTDSSLALMSDMAPLNGTGKPKRNVSPGAVPKEMKSWNSGNHQGDGQNVGFADGHAEFVRRADVGQGDDNIFTVSGVKGVSQFGGVQPGKSRIEIQTESAPFDVVMVPARDLGTGSF